MNLRPTLARHLRQRLEAFRDGFRQNLALVGPPRLGKSFQLRALAADPPAGLRVIYVPLDEETPRQLVTRLVQAFTTGAPSSSPALGEAVQAVDRALGRRLHAEAFVRALDLLPVVAKQDGRPMALILDEFLCLEHAGLSHAFHELGKRVMTWPFCLFVLASSSAARARTILRERLQLLFGQFELLDMEPLDTTPAVRWVQQQLRGLRSGRLTAPFLVHWLGGVPWYLEVMATRLRELAAIGRTRELTQPLVLRAAWDVLGSSSGVLHQWCASRVSLSPGPGRTGLLEILVHIAEGCRTSTELGRRLGRTALPAALQTLLDHGLVERLGACWSIPDPVLRCWLATGLWAQRADPSRASADVRSRFEQALQERWDQWELGRLLSLPQRVADLLSRFRDETVALDEKTARLPRFARIRTAPQQPEEPVYLVAEAPSTRWCCSVSERALTEAQLATFEAFCRQQSPRPARKVVVCPDGLEPDALVLAKASGMWVWKRQAMGVLTTLYGPPQSPQQASAGV